MNHNQTALTKATSSNTAVALRSAWQADWPAAYKALPIKASHTAAEVCALQTVAPAISVINQGAADAQAGIDVFMTELVRLTQFMGAEWSDYQLEECAELLYADLFHWTFAELKHFTLRVQKVEFDCQKDYGKLSPKHIMQCANQHANEVMQARMDYNRYGPPKAAEADTEPVTVPPEVVEEAMAAWHALRDDILATLRTERDTEEARLRQERQQQDEALLRQYCSKEGLDYEEVRGGL